MKYVGNYRVNESCVPTSYWVTNTEQPMQVLRSKFPALQLAPGLKTVVNNTCPLIDGEYGIRPVPYGAGHQEIDAVIQDCDLLSYLDGQPVIALDGSLLGLFKQRGYHAETSYLDEAHHACQVAVWSETFKDRLFDVTPTDRNRINIYRLSLARLGVTPEREKALKHELLRWKAIFCHHHFPNGASMNYDPVDFLTVGELADIAKKLIRKEYDKVEKVNCVQWTCTAVSLALNFPLTHKVVADLGVATEYERDWAPNLGYADDELVGIASLPIPFYSPARLFQKSLDMFLPGLHLLDLMAFPGGLEALTGKLPGMLGGLGSDIPVQKAAGALARYFNEVKTDGDLDAPLVLPADMGGRTVKFVMPSTFILEERASHQLGPDEKKALFNYVATAMPADELIKIED